MASSRGSTRAGARDRDSPGARVRRRLDVVHGSISISKWMRGRFDAWRGCTSDRQVMLGAPFLPRASRCLAPSCLHAGNHSRKLGSTLKTPDAQDVWTEGGTETPGEKKGRPPLGGGPRYRLARAKTGPPDQPGHHQRIGTLRTFMGQAWQRAAGESTKQGRRRAISRRRRPRGWRALPPLPPGEGLYITPA